MVANWIVCQTCDLSISLFLAKTCVQASKWLWWQNVVLHAYAVLVKKGHIFTVKAVVRGIWNDFEL